MPAFLQDSFTQRALLAALLLGPLCALLGVFVTARRMSFFSDTISHAALAGVAIGFWLKLTDPTLAMIAVSLGVAAAMIWLRENTDLLTDTIMALLLSGSVAFGITLMSWMKNLRKALESYLFGDILAVDWSDVGLALGLFLVVGGGVLWKLGPLTLLTAHEDMAHVCGVRVRGLNYAFVVVLTLAIAVAIRLLGILLVTALIVIPPAAARNLACNLRQQIWLSVALGLAGSVGGTVLAWQLDTPTGPAIVLTSIGLFIVALLVGRIREQARAIA